MCIGKYTSKYSEHFYVVFRVVIGLMFFMHGFLKFSAMNVPVASLFGVAGIVEILAGLGILVGMFSRLAAVGGLVTMVVALATQHFPKGINPLANGGELAVLYLIAFLIILGKGNGKASLEKALLKKEMC
ncbi:DoxX family protein [Candidatus Woesearchaeota archaeon]|nr:DoxX family protein [Candidatus Woesearchaeota archaeon]